VSRSGWRGSGYPRPSELEAATRLSDLDAAAKKLQRAKAKLRVDADRQLAQAVLKEGGPRDGKTEA
jgi:hypothetical protein